MLQAVGNSTCKGSEAGAVRRGCRAGGRAGQEGTVEPRRPQQELWVDVKQEWDDVGRRGRGCSRNNWVTWWLVLGLAMERQGT